MRKIVQQVLYFAILTILISTAIYLFLGSTKSKNEQVRFKKNRYKEFVDSVKDQLDQNEMKEALEKTGLHITLFQYLIVRYVLFAYWIFMIITKAIKYRYHYSYGSLWFVLFMFFITSPKAKVFGTKTLFNRIVDLLTYKYRKKKDAELYRAVLQLKNLAIARQDKPLGADFIIQQLMSFTDITRPIFANMLSNWRMGQEEEACEGFAKAIDTKQGEDLANIFLKLDKLNPIQMKQQLILYQSNVRAEKKTDKLKENEFTSILVFIPTIAQALMIVWNFVVIVVILEQINVIKHLQ